MYTIPTQHKQKSEQWINDYLDLYNFAKKIGDEEWQRSIIQMLKQKDEHIQNELKYSLQQSLWAMFDEINRSMLELYEQIRRSRDERVKEALQEQVWDLRNRRMLISRELRTTAK